MHKNYQGSKPSSSSNERAIARCEVPTSVTIEPIVVAPLVENSGGVTDDIENTSIDNVCDQTYQEDTAADNKDEDEGSIPPSSSKDVIVPKTRKKRRVCKKLNKPAKNPIKPNKPAKNPIPVVTGGYDKNDSFIPQLPTFSPSHPPGVYRDVATRNQTRAIDFFNLFFTNDLIESIPKHTNTYAYSHILNKPAYALKDGSWKETTPSEIKQLIALLIYQGIVHVPTFHRYWNTKSLFHGLWAREFMSRDRFKQLMSMLHIVDPGNELKVDKLRKVSPVINSFRQRCKALFQPFENVAVDERIVKSKQIRYKTIHEK